MNTEFRRVKDIFLAALERAPGDEWEAYLREACGDGALRQQVDALLGRHEQAGSFLEAPPARLETTVARTETGERPGAMVGPYKLLEQLGEGGFGTVFMAEQSHPVRRRVAFKVLKLGMDNRQVVARFEAERQALALMDHPDIAKVFDAGETDSGRPYFVMELVKGVPITDFCDQNRLPTRQRLELFATVCAAVQHAHQKGIIHRDIKPSNVLVSQHDVTPVVKVIDFGIAKALGQELTDKTLFTGFGQMIGTPLYMSPEQAGMSDLDVDTRSDVYALGVLLYELLTGTTPFTKDRFRQASYDEIRRIIREEEPPRPSTRLSESGDTLTAISAQRQTDPGRLTRLVRGDLDWIVMKALEKDRNRRYESPSAFAADVQRYLADEPVQARPPSAGYRLRKFVRRNKRPVVAVVVIALLLLLGIVGTTTGLIMALAAEKKAIADRNEKEEVRRRTRQALNQMTDEVLEDLLGSQMQLTDKHREFLKRVLAYHAEFAAAKVDDPEGRQSRADGYFRVGRIYFSLGEYKDSEAAYRSAASIQDELTTEFPTRAEFREQLATTHNYLGNTLSATGQMQAAEAAYRTALTTHQQLAVDFPDRSEFRQQFARDHSNVRNVLRNTGRLDEAETLDRQAIAAFEQLVRDVPDRTEYRTDLADAYYTLGEILNATHRAKEAEAVYRQALAVRQKAAIDFPNRTEAHRNLALNHIQLAVTLSETGRPKEAEAAYHDAIRAGKQLTAAFPGRPDYRQELGLAYQNLGVLIGGSRPKEAEEDFREALGIFRQLTAAFPGRPDFRGCAAMAQASLANTLLGLKRPKESEEAYRDALSLFQQLAIEQPKQVEYPWEVVHVHLHLAEFCRATRRFKQAEDAYREAIAGCERLVAEFPKRHAMRHDLALAHIRLADLLAETDRLKDAEPAYREAIAQWKRAAEDAAQPEPRVGPPAAGSFGVQPVHVRSDAIAQYRAALAVAHYNLGNHIVHTRPEDGIVEFREVLRLEPDYPEARTNLGRTLLDQGNVDEAIGEFRTALRTKKRFPERFIAYTNLGNALLEKGQREDAITAYRVALRFNENYAAAYYGLGNVYFPHRPEEAAAAYRRAVELVPNDAEYHNNYGNALKLAGDLNAAIAEYKRAIQLDGNLLKAHLSLGLAFAFRDKLDDAIAEYRTALALDKDNPAAHFFLAEALQKKGLYQDAVAEYQEALRLKNDFPGAREGIRNAERLVALAKRLPAILADKDKPKDAAESVAFADICQSKARQQYAAAVRFFGDAFAADPKLAENRDGWDRYNAACAAALAGSGQGKDAGELDAKERARLRQQSLDWLRADLKAWDAFLAKEPGKAPAVANILGQWLDDADFEGVHNPDALAKLPEDEQKLWRALWADIAELAKRAREKVTPGK